MSKTRVMVQAAMLVAISVVLTRFLAINASIGGVYALRLSFGELPLMLAGLLFGPVVGALAGVSADLTGIALFPPPAIFPGFTLSAALTGALPPLVWRGVRAAARLVGRQLYTTETPNKQSRQTEAPKAHTSGGPRLPLGLASLLAIVLVTSLTVSGLNTVWLHVLYSTPYVVLLPPRLLSEAVLIPAHALLLQGTLRTYAAAFLGAHVRRSA